MEPKILYIEDNVLNLRLVRKFLEMGGFHNMIEALDGLSGIELAMEAMPHLILMDINLPDIDGWEATRRIKATPALAHIPIVAVTANTSLDDRQRCFAAGCQGFLGKPLTKNELLDTVRTFLQIPVEPASASSVPAVSVQPAATQTPPMPPTLPPASSASPALTTASSSTPSLSEEEDDDAPTQPTAPVNDQPAERKPASNTADHPSRPSAPV